MPPLPRQGRSLATKVNAPEFVPGEPSSSNSEAAPKPSTGGSTLSASSVQATPFVPGGGAKLPSNAVRAAEFVPSGTGVIAQKSASAPGPGFSPNLKSKLPQDDDALGMTAHSPGGDHLPSGRGRGRGGRHPGYASSMGRGVAPGPAEGWASGRGRGRGRDSGRGGSNRGGPGPGGSTGGTGGGAGGGSNGLCDRIGASNPLYLAPGRVQMAAKFVSERLRHELQQRNFLLSLSAPPEAEGGLPEQVSNFHSLYPLEEVQGDEPLSVALGVRSFVLKAISQTDGSAIALRRIDGKQVVPTGELISAAQEAVDRWAQLAAHPGLVALRGAFVSDELDGTPALFLAHEYHPGAITLEALHVQPNATPAGLVRHAPSEEQLWAYLIQLCAAIRAVHTRGLLVRPGLLCATKVLLTTGGRIRIGCIGVLDALHGADAARACPAGQQEDLRALGRLMLTLACAGSGAPPALEYCATHYSLELAGIVGQLHGAPDTRAISSWQALTVALAPRVLDHMESTHLHSDALVAELGKEVDAGRLLRVLVKMNFVTERPDGDMEPQWSETGDRYLVKLFRDFVFHQVSEEGTPQLDFGHVLETLNKVDAGVPEQIVLLSRDEMNIMVVSYADIKRCIEGTYSELRSRASSAGMPKPGHASAPPGSGHMPRGPPGSTFRR